MQWPPMPGPGVNRMNPNGFVAAASITSQTFTPKPIANNRHLVHQPDVHRPEGVLEQLDELSRFGRRDRHDGLDAGPVERARDSRCRRA